MPRLSAELYPRWGLMIDEHTGGTNDDQHCEDSAICTCFDNPWKYFLIESERGSLRERVTQIPEGHHVDAQEGSQESQQQQQRPRPRHAPKTSRRERAAAAAAAAEAEAAGAQDSAQRSRPGLLRAAEVAARAHSQWALLEAADVQAAVAEAAALKEVGAAISLLGCRERDCYPI